MSRTSALPAYGTLRHPFDLKVRSQNLGNTSTPQAKKESNRTSTTTKVALGVLGASAVAAASIFLYRNPTALSDLYKWTASFFVDPPYNHPLDPDGVCDPSKTTFIVNDFYNGQAECMKEHLESKRPPPQIPAPAPTTQAPNSDPVAACAKKLMEYSSDAMISKIANALGGSTAFCNLPILSWQERFEEGGTGYIDGVQPGDLSSSIMRGVDPWGRSYVSIRTERRTSGDEGTLGVETLFQRYSDSSERWVSGNHYDKTPLFDEVGHDLMIDRLRNLSSGQPLVISRPLDITPIVIKKLV